MIDPAQLSSAFLSGPELLAEQIDVNVDRLAYFWWDGNQFLAYLF